MGCDFCRRPSSSSPVKSRHCLLVFALAGCFGEPSDLDGEDGASDTGSSSSVGASSAGAETQSGTGVVPTGSGPTGDTGDTGDTGVTDETSGSSSSSGSTTTTTTTSGTTEGVECALAEPTVEPIFRFGFDGDATNEGSTGDAYDGAETEVDYVEGLCADAADFSGSAASQIVIADTLAPLSSGFDYTIGVWFREDEAREGFLLDFRAQDGATTGGGLIVFDGASDDLTTCASVAPGGSTGGCRGIPYSLGVWHHLLYRCDGTALVEPGGCDLEIYLDNVLVDTMTQSGRVIFSPDQAEDLTLGGGDDSAFIIDELRIFDTVFDLQGQCEEVMGGTWADPDCDIGR